MRKPQQPRPCDRSTRSALLEHLKANGLSEDTMALLLSHLNLDIPDDVSNGELELKGLSTRKD